MGLLVTVQQRESCEPTTLFLSNTQRKSNRYIRECKFFTLLLEFKPKYHMKLTSFPTCLEFIKLGAFLFPGL